MPVKHQSLHAYTPAIMVWHNNRGVIYLPVGWILTIFAIMAYFLRMYTRAWLTRSLGSDDFAITLGFVSNTNRAFLQRACSDIDSAP